MPSFFATCSVESLDIYGSILPDTRENVNALTKSSAHFGCLSLTNSQFKKMCSDIPERQASAMQIQGRRQIGPLVLYDVIVPIFYGSGALHARYGLELRQAGKLYKVWDQRS